MIRYYVHRYALMQAGVNVDGFHVDHICHNKSCVRPHHLRTVTPKQNMENRSGANSNNPTGIRGVSRYKDGRWRGFVGHLGQCTYRTFRTREDAVEWVTAKRLELFTHNDADRTEAVCR